MNQVIIVNSERRHFPTSNSILKILYMRLENIYLRVVFYYHILPKLRKIKKKAKIIASDIETENILNKKNIPFSSIGSDIFL